MDPKDNDFQEMMANFLQNAQKMQEGLRKAYHDIAEKNKNKTVTGKAGGDLVIAHVSLSIQVARLELKPEIFQEKLEVIGELITAAINQGIVAAQEAVKKEMVEVAKKMGLPTDAPLPFSK